MGRRRLTPDDVRRLVFEAFETIRDVQGELDLPICPNLGETHKRMRRGIFRVSPISRERSNYCAAKFSAFDPPSTIILDSRLPHCDCPADEKDTNASMARYGTIKGVMHADDYTGGDLLLERTREHILREHSDKLERSLAIILQQGSCESIESFEDLARLWAAHYVDMVAHYRAFVVLRRRLLPNLDLIWSRLRNSFFPPTLLSDIERQEGLSGVFDLITKGAGDYCLIDALRECERISELNACRYVI